MFIGAGHIGGAYLFVRTALGSPWHRVAPGFLPVTAFTLSRLVVTVLHWARFDIRHLPLQLWQILYVVTPFLIPYLWHRNRVEDAGAPEEGGAVVPAVTRWGMPLVGAVIAVFALIGLVSPCHAARAVDVDADPADGAHAGRLVLPTRSRRAHDWP